ncbi:glycerol dehydrogenase [Cupriavidus sp. UYMSc13B]|nr:glycerol dehydrogenase [Cupriavidus sp. UYMSc13B]
MALPEVPPGIRMMGFPGQYLQGAGALQHLGGLLIGMGYQRPTILCDAIIADKVWPTVAGSLQSHGIEATPLPFPGECTRAVIDLLASQARDGNPDVIVGLGGGKAVDTAKGVSLALNVPVVICPTIASNDAPTSRLIALYDDAHRLTGVDFLKANPAAVVVDTQIIARRAPRFFAAGIGDAISKKFEAAQCKATGRNNAFGTPPLDTGLLLAGATYETLVKYAPAAYRAIERQQLNEAVERVVEATVLLSGVGFEGGGLSLAHALTRGFGAVSAMAHTLHGEQVAFGTLVQLVAEQRAAAEIAELLDLLCAVNLPVTLAQLGVPAAQLNESVACIASTTLNGQTRNLISSSLSPAGLEAALLRADAIGAAAMQ